MIEARLDKIKFIIDEMQIAFVLTKEVDDQFIARMLARHVLIRAQDFIAHTRALKKPLNIAGYDTREFHKLKEIYATDFDEYFVVSRDKLGAHIQDLDFGKRIELWKDIEVTKIGHFCEGALDVYDSLSALSLPNYQTYTKPSVITDGGISVVFEEYRRANSETQGIEIASDPLALTRKDTTASLNTTPIHARAGQLSLIRRWIEAQIALLKLVDGQLSISRILKARILTDIVSFSDCLVTRSVSSGAPQEMDGLDTLLVAASQSSIIIDDFVSKTNFDTELSKIRDVRNQICAHMEISPSTLLASVLNRLDTFDFDEAVKFYRNINSVFGKVCREVFFLRMYEIDGQKIQGILVSQNSAEPYLNDEALGPPTDAPAVPVYDKDEVYNQNLQRWLYGSETQKEEARYFFWNAFSHSPAIENLEEIEDYGSSTHYRSHDFRVAHRFILSVLEESSNNQDFRGVLELLTSCSSGHPYSLNEILVRYAPIANDEAKLLLCVALGEINNSTHKTADDFLQSCIGSRHAQIRIQARVAIFKRFVGLEGIYRANNKGQTRNSFELSVMGMLESLQGSEKLFCTLAFASSLCSPPANTFHRHFEPNYINLQSLIKEHIGELIHFNADANDMLEKLINTHDYVGVCGYIVDYLDGGKENPLYSLLLDSCCDGTIRALSSDQSRRNLAICYHLREHHTNASAIASQLALKNPENVMSQIFSVEMQISDAEDIDVIMKNISDIRRRYQLDAIEENRLIEIEAYMAAI